MKLRLLEAGSCLAPERVMRRDGRWARVRVPAGVALIEHPSEGVVLVDTGYAPRSFDAARARWDARAFARLVPPSVGPDTSAAGRLRVFGIAPEAVAHIVVTHFHADHAAGLRDFPNAAYHFLPDALGPVRRARIGERAAFPASFLPDDFDHRARPIHARVLLPSALAPFADGVAVLPGIVGVPLPGHAPGHLGVAFESDAGPVLIAADAAWHLDVVRDPRLMSGLGMLVQHDRAAYRATLGHLHALSDRRPDLRIVLLHDARSWLGACAEKRAAFQIGTV